ncbi:MAG: hypothetical protein ACI4PC_07255 [Oscillospiraceae bacterium]
MLESVVNAVIAALKDRGIDACAAYPRQPLAARSGCLVCAAVKSAAQTQGGFAGYLGVKTDENGNQTELYGLRCALELALDIYAPMDGENGAADCVRCFDAVTAALGGLGSGLKILELRCGEAAPDRESGMFRCRCGAKALAFLSAESAGDGEAAGFSDFILKGELRK